MYKICATFRCNNLRPAYNKRYTQKCNPKEELRFTLIIVGPTFTHLWGKKAYKTDKQHLLVSYSTSTTVVGLVTFLW